MKNVLPNYLVRILALIISLPLTLTIYAQSDHSKDTSWEITPPQTGINTSYIPIDSSISINLHAYDYGNGFATLKWSLTVQDSSILSGCYFKVYRKLPLGIWTLIDSNQTYSYLDTLAVCWDTISYKIGVKVGSSNNEIFSNISSDFFKDIIPPSITVIDTIIFDPQTGDATLSWFPNQWNDVAKYVIYKNITQIFTPIDTIYNYHNYTYTDTSNSSSSIPSITDYGIAAIDSCNNQSMMSFYTSVEDIDKSPSLKIYPNPTSGFINLQFKKSIDNDIEISVLDFSGRLLLNEMYSNQKTIKLNISDLDNGIYLIKIRTGQVNTLVVKIIKN